MDLKSYLCHSIEFVLNRLNDRFHESDGIRYLVTHIDRILYILSPTPSLFKISRQLECFVAKSSSNVNYPEWGWQLITKAVVQVFRLQGSSQYRYSLRTSGAIPWEEPYSWTNCSTFLCVFQDDLKTHQWISTPLWKTQFSNRSRIGRWYISMNSSIV